MPAKRGAYRIYGAYMETKKFDKHKMIKDKDKKDKIKKPRPVLYDIEIGVNERGTLCSNLDEFPVAGPII